jgi:hypothetical protein
MKARESLEEEKRSSRHYEMDKGMGAGGCAEAGGGGA